MSEQYKPTKIQAGQYSYRGRIITREYQFDSRRGFGHTWWCWGGDERETLQEACQSIDMMISLRAAGRAEQAAEVQR